MIIDVMTLMIISLKSMDVFCSIKDPRISGLYIYNNGTWYNDEKGVHLYRDYYGENHAKKSNLDIPADYVVFSLSSISYALIEDRLAFVEAKADNFINIDGIITPVPVDNQNRECLINGEIYGVPKEEVLKHSFTFME